MLADLLFGCCSILCALNKLSKYRLEGILSQCYTDSQGFLLLLPSVTSTSTSVELANSSLGFIKSPGRSSVTENQLIVFLLLYCHRDIFVIDLDIMAHLDRNRCPILFVKFALIHPDDFIKEIPNLIEIIV